MWNGKSFDGIEQTAQQLPEGLPLEAAGSDGELFAADAANITATIPHTCLEGVAERLKRTVTSLMSVMVIEALEVVDIQHGEMEELPLCLGLGERLLGLLLEPAPVSQICEHIRCGLFMEQAAHQELLTMTAFT